MNDNKNRNIRFTVTSHNMRAARRCIYAVFHDLIFPTADMRHYIMDSYLDNLSDMILYAKKNGLNLYDYIRSIKQELLKDARVRER